MNETNNDNDELNNILGNSDKRESTLNYVCSPLERNESEFDDVQSKKLITKSIQWATHNGVIFTPTSTTVDVLPPGYYEINASSDIGLYFENVPIKLDNILNFPDAVTDKVVKEIQSFWDKEDIFREFNLLYKRGIILWGPPGSGKTTTLQLVSKDVIERNGVVIKFVSPYTFVLGVRKLREIQPNTPIVVLMEDLDTIIDRSESEIINILDGVDKLDKIVFLATTNYPERIGDRVMNRPSRFDKRHKVGFINAAARKMYFEFLISDKKVDIDIARWVKDTENFSIAHLKELFIAVVILGDNYENAIKTLQSMKIKEHSVNDNNLYNTRIN